MSHGILFEDFVRMRVASTAAPSLYADDPSKPITYLLVASRKTWLQPVLPEVLRHHLAPLGQLDRCEFERTRPLNPPVELLPNRSKTRFQEMHQ
ncbi:hypothetical protein OSB_03580 [Octadecabacter temperatus]|uniref:Uncharacterized protein n=1 Tax=Octadecabacter temperatus TaxID=1458307 RepID=A0A0K0Y1W0_9RHOB|nr:hypothetical protein OSB_03580 [Octadecabacter temperatus]